MASPPFNINQLVPGDNDIVSQYPPTERTFRDIVESWFLFEGNNMGRKNRTGFDWQSSAPAGTANVTTIWADTTGLLKFRSGTGTIQDLVGAPLGSVFPYIFSTAPAGYIFSFGQAVTTSYPVLRQALIDAGYPFGQSGSDPLLPDLRGRVVFGKDNMGGTGAGRLTTAGGGVDGLTLGASGGNQSYTFLQANLPNLNFTVNIPAGQGSHSHSYTSVSYSGGSDGGPNGYLVVQIGASTGAATLPAMSGTAASGGSGTPLQMIPPGIVLNFIVRAY